MIAAVAALALGTVTMSTGAMAVPHGGHGFAHGGGFARGGHGGFGPGFALGAGLGGLYDFGGGYYGGCYQQRWVPTPYGYRWRTVNVCY